MKPQEPAPPEKPLLPESIPIWLHGILIGLLIGGLVSGLTFLMALGTLQGPGADEVTRWFALVAGLVGFYAGNCVAGPKPVRGVLVHLVSVSLVTLIGYVLVESEKFAPGGRHGRSVVLAEGPAVAVLGVLVILVGGGWVASAPLREKPRTVTGIVSTILAASIVVAGMFLAVRHLLAKYG